MDILSTFLPLDRRYALAANQPMPDRTAGAALFADISGFTPLTAVLAEESGPHRGAEELSRQLNRVFTDLINEVHRFGGSVISFSGDAITCWFDQNINQTQPPVNLALACALAMQRDMAELANLTTPGGKSIALTLKVAVAVGPARRFLAGDPNQRHLEVLAGATLDQMAAAESVAGKGEIIVTPDALNALHPKPLIKQTRTTSNGLSVAVIDNATPSPAQPAPLTPPAIPAAVARSWILPPVYARLQEGHGDFLAELRPSVALFIKFSGIDYDQDDEAGVKLDTFVRRTHAVLQRYDGYLLQINIGDKGSYFYVSFGAPIAHEDDTRRAAQAALALHQLQAELDFVQPLQIGINQGLAFSGAYGSPVRRTFGVIGNHVNIAARLMTNAAPGQTLVSQTIATILDNSFDLLELPAIPLKGVRDLFRVWALQGKEPTAAPLFSEQTLNPMIGREPEIALMQEQLETLANGRSAVLFIEGAAGIGKSRLIQEFVNHVDRDAIHLFVGSGSAIEQDTLYRAWQPVFEGIGGDLLSPAAMTSAWQAGILEYLGPDNDQLAPLLNPLLPQELPETALTAQLTGELRQEKTLQLLTDVLKTAVASHPLILIIEDAHWLDSASWALLRRVQAQLQPLLLILAARPFSGVTPSVYTDLREQAVLMPLEPLPLADIDVLICQRLGIDTLPNPVKILIHEKAEGHPFFSEELAYALRDSGLIYIENGTCRLAAHIQDFSALDFPDTIQGVITSRIDQLAPSQQLTLKVASVIGRVFAYRLLSTIFPTSQQQMNLLQDLDLLAQLDLTPKETPEPNLTYIFKHIVTQEVAYSLMTFAQRQQLHRKTAVWYEDMQESDLTRHYPLLAYHWRHAGDTGKAISYYGKAGENAFFNYANQEAIRFLTQALKLDNQTNTVSPFQKATWERQIAEAAYRLTHMEQSETHYKAALHLMGRPVPKSTPGRIQQIVWQLSKQRFHRWFPKHYVARAASDLEKTTLLETSRAYEGISEIYYNKGDFLTTFLCVMTAFNLAEEAGPSPELVRGYANMCSTLGTIAFHKPAQNYRRRALEMADQIDDPAAQAWSRIPLSSYSLQSGAWQRGETEIDEALTIYNRLGDWRRWCIAAWMLPQISQGKGDLKLARQQWEALYEVALRSQDTRHQVRAQGGHFFNNLSLGLVDEAFSCLETVGRVLSENPEMMPIEERLWYGMEATSALYKEQWREARELAHEQMAAISRAPLKFDLLAVFAASAEVMLALWERDEASSKEAQQGIKTVSSFARSNAFARPRATCLQGQYAWLSGKKRKAEKLWQKSLTLAKTLQMPYEQARALQYLGRSLQNSAYLAEADALFAQITGDSKG